MINPLSLKRYIKKLLFIIDKRGFKKGVKIDYKNLTDNPDNFEITIEDKVSSGKYNYKLIIKVQTEIKPEKTNTLCLMH